MRSLSYLSQITRDVETPFLVFDVSRLKDNYNLICNTLDHIQVYYPLKANDHPRILKALYRWGSGFEAASWGEIQLLRRLGIPPEKIIFGATIKKEDHISFAFREGVRYFAFDSTVELFKLSRLAPGKEVFLRLAVPDGGNSVFPLSGKFGAQAEKALSLLVMATELGLQPRGLSFHVGSQCESESNWWKAIEVAADIWSRVGAIGLTLEFLNVGGGIPVYYDREVPSKKRILYTISRALRQYFPRQPRILLEPGRALVGDAAIMVTTIIGEARRNGTRWLYIDAGSYQGLLDTVLEKERFAFEVITESRERPREYDIGGPTCDGLDVVFRGIELPEVHVGDRLYIKNTGAYTRVLSTQFNGFPPPRFFFIGDEEEEVDRSWRKVETPALSRS